MPITIENKSREFQRFYYFGFCSRVDVMCRAQHAIFRVLRLQVRIFYFFIFEVLRWCGGTRCIFPCGNMIMGLAKQFGSFGNETMLLWHRYKVACALEHDCMGGSWTSRFGDHESMFHPNDCGKF